MTSFAKSQWIGPDEALSLGDKGFLIRFHNENTGSTRFALRDTPAHTNQSQEPQLHGWCGSYNNISTSGCGMVIVKRMAKNGRAYVEQLEGVDLESSLEEFGYPDLT